jgi:hypothetical protein
MVDNCFQGKGEKMIFGSLEFSALKHKFENKPDFEKPEILLIESIEEYSAEKKLLESVLQEVYTDYKSVAREWKKGLLSEHRGNYLGSWFEVMFYDYLKGIGDVVPKPKYKSNFPDFLIKFNDKSVFIECTSVDYSKEEQQVIRVFDILGSLDFDFGIDVKSINYINNFNEQDFVIKVDNWANEILDSPFLYPNIKQAKIKLEKRYNCQGVCGPTFSVSRTDSSRYVDDLYKKAQQHRDILKDKMPYVIAIFSKQSLHNLSYLRNAWLGDQKFVYDMSKGEFLSEVFDNLGVGFEDGTPTQNSVTGLLFVKVAWGMNDQRRSLKVSYFPNPNSDNRFDFLKKVFQNIEE